MANEEVYEIDVSKIVAETTAAVKAQMKAEQDAEAARKAEINTAVENAIKATTEKLTKEHEEEIKKLAGRKSAPAFNQVAGKYSKSQGIDEFRHWMKTGDNGNERVLKWDPMIGDDGKKYEEATPEGRKALQIGSDTEGGYLVPEDFYSMIVEKRDQMAWTQNANISRIQTSLTVLPFPTEATSMGKFEVTAEEAAYSDSDPIFGNVDVTVYKFTRMNKFSEELLADQAANLNDFYSRSLARAWALTESYYIAVGTGSSQPQGVYVGGTAALTFDSAAQIDATEIPELYYLLGQGYRREASWLVNDETIGYLRGIRDGNDFAFDMRGNNIGVSASGFEWEKFYGGKPIYAEDGVSTIATGVKTVLVGDFSFYGLAEREGLAIARNPYLYQANGQVAFFAKVRWGGAVLQAEAFQYATQA